MKEFTSGYAGLFVSRVLGQVNDPRQTRVEVHFNLVCVQRHSEFKTFFGIPADEVLSIVSPGALIIDYRVSVPSNFTKQI